MKLDGYVDNLRSALAVAADAGGGDARALADRLTAPLDAAVRIMLLDALSAAAAEITLDLAPGSVDLRLRSGEPAFVVTPPPADEPPPSPAPPLPAGQEGDDGATARINLRLPEHLKAAAERNADRDRLSLNAWMVRVVAAELARGDRDPPPVRGGRGGRGFTGWVR